MCGIFGSTDKERFETLYNLNRERGDFAFGCLLLSKDKNVQYCEAQPGVVNVSEFYDKEYSYLLGHTQAPTSSERGFSRQTSHPFVDGNWIVAHNGVLSNFEILKQKYLPEHTNPVDSSIIPALLSNMECNNEVKTIVSVMEAIEGTYSLWLYNTNSKNIYVVRCGSTLYGNLLQCEFSSYPDVGLNELEDNSIYIVTREGLTKIADFLGNSPFFIV
jgi:glucosamine 6-phosphate synthetase-like amidotransferase/phosphosugar isomerase protein